MRLRQLVTFRPDFQVRFMQFPTQQYPLQQIKYLEFLILTVFSAFEVPDFELAKLLIMDGFIISMVSYTVSVSMALIFAQKLNYEIDFNQELLAMGASNVFGSFYACLPVSASLSRSAIQQSTGGRTQIASIISCGLLTFVLLWIGPFFEILPRVSSPYTFTSNSMLT